MTDNTTATLVAFGDMLNEAFVTGQALNLSPCEALEYAFPAIVKNDDIMGALAALLAPAVEVVAMATALYGLDEDAAEGFLHNVFHLLQIAAALGHMIGVDEATGASLTIPEDLSSLSWEDLPDVLGEE